MSVRPSSLSLVKGVVAYAAGRKGLGLGPVLHIGQ